MLLYNVLGSLIRLGSNVPGNIGNWLGTVLTPDFDWKHIQPVLGKGNMPVLSATIPYIGFPFCELVLFLLVYPKVRIPKQAGHAFLKGTLLGGIVLFVITLLSILVLGGENTASYMYSSFELAKKIKIGEAYSKESRLSSQPSGL